MIVDRDKLTELLINNNVIAKRGGFVKEISDITGYSYQFTGELLRKDYSKVRWDGRQMIRLISYLIGVHIKEFVDEYKPIPKIYVYHCKQYYIRDILKKRGYTLKDIGKECGITGGRVSEVFREKHTVTGNDGMLNNVHCCFSVIAEKIGVSVDSLFVLDHVIDYEKLYEERLNNIKEIIDMFKEIIDMFKKIEWLHTMPTTWYSKFVEIHQKE